jgi:hypothetical protein
MTEKRDIELNTGTRHKYEIQDREQSDLIMERQFPLDPLALGRTCKMSPPKLKASAI